VLLPPALATGKLTIVTGAMAREVLTNDEGLATGVSYVDTATGQVREVRARIVVLAASACESARLLLNSKSPRHPAGLANSSGTVGKYLTDTLGTGMGGQIPALEGLPSFNEDGVGGMHMYVPWWLDNKKLDFPRGYHIELGGGRNMPGWGFMNGIQWTQGGGYGAKLKEDYRRLYGSFVWLSGRGEMIPNEGSYCELDPSVVDKWGIPVLRFHWKWSEHELNQARHMNDTFAEIIDKMGGRLSGTKPPRTADHGLKAGGEIIHEAGCTRMGDNPRTSVLNRWCQAHDARNVFVADSGPFVSNAHKNMTWTILALSWRTSEHIAEERNKGNL
jgi:choline dehydrogenase-like flavoprotein